MIAMCCCDVVQEKLESAQREAQVLEIKRQGQLKALEAQRAKKEVGKPPLSTRYPCLHQSCSWPALLTLLLLAATTLGCPLMTAPITIIARPKSSVRF